MADLHVLATQRLRLRPYEERDVDALYALWIDADVRRWMRDDRVITREQAALEVRESIDRFTTHGFGEWVLLPREEPRVIGFCGFRFVTGTPEIEILYGLAPDCWGKGLATEAAREVLRFGFAECRLARVTGSADAPNTASLHVLEKIGLRFARRELRGSLDLVDYALTRAEWAAAAR